MKCAVILITLNKRGIFGKNIQSGGYFEKKRI